uniref:Uncharacterized protein n=1 Tax=Chromera velia CCMP2878 TaxID=1169474 RepID=A0A0G4HBY0_9ALVE|eukprot:Cvel_26062.t1-p1 / transcript=Cvel_26062.t1 / gene=Cvel_26062 / organism=Chromera_velia_CCMP2878 / gene_product=hypothetical protein / transcript_product=hypothetical protein / location=Cvel_scaffold3040:121-1632(-) / protein_length=504 / sequence_SO=supercontig / SO=protein_coding / is_pseudo=false
MSSSRTFPFSSEISKLGWSVSGHPQVSVIPELKQLGKNPADNTDISKVAWALSIWATCLRGRQAGEEDGSAVSIAKEAAKALSKKGKDFLTSVDTAHVSGLKGFAAANEVRFVNVFMHSTKLRGECQSSDNNCRKKGPLHFVIGLDSKQVELFRAPTVAGAGTAASSPRSGDSDSHRPDKKVHAFFRQALVNLVNEYPDSPSLNLSVGRANDGRVKSLILFHPTDTESGDNLFQPDADSLAHLEQWAENLKKDGGSLARLSFEICMNDVEGSVEERVADFVKKVRTVLSKPPSAANTSTLPTPPGSDPNNSSDITFILDPDSLCRIACCGREVREGSEAAGIVEMIRSWGHVMVFGGGVEQYGGRKGKNLKGPSAAALPASAAAAASSAAPAVPPSSSVFRNPGTAPLLGGGTFVSTTASMECEKRKEREDVEKDGGQRDDMEGAEGASSFADPNAWSFTDEGQAASRERFCGKRSHHVDEPSQSVGGGAAAQGGVGGEDGEEE